MVCIQFITYLFRCKFAESSKSPFYYCVFFTISNLFAFIFSYFQKFIYKNQISQNCKFCSISHPASGFVKILLLKYDKKFKFLQIFQGIPIIYILICKPDFLVLVHSFSLRQNVHKKLTKLFRFLCIFVKFLMTISYGLFKAFHFGAGLLADAPALIRARFFGAAVFSSGFEFRFSTTPFSPSLLVLLSPPRSLRQKPAKSFRFSFTFPILSGFAENFLSGVSRQAAQPCQPPLFSPHRQAASIGLPYAADLPRIPARIRIRLPARRPGQNAQRNSHATENFPVHSLVKFHSSSRNFPVLSGKAVSCLPRLFPQFPDGFSKNEIAQIYEVYPFSAGVRP